MKKAEKLEYLRKSAGTYSICKCQFLFEDHPLYFYILDYSDKFMFGVEESDFILNGFQIRKLSRLKKIESTIGICARINEKNRLLENISKPAIDLASWKSVFESLKTLDSYIIVESEREETEFIYESFYIGVIKKVKRSSVIFSPFDVNGVWLDDAEIPFSEIIHVTFGDRYSKTWQEYLQEHKDSE